MEKNFDYVAHAKYEQDLRDRIRTLRGKLPGLAKQPVLNGAEMMAIYEELGGIEDQLVKAQIERKQAEIAELEGQLIK